MVQKLNKRVKKVAVTVALVVFCTSTIKTLLTTRDIGTLSSLLLPLSSVEVEAKKNTHQIQNNYKSFFPVNVTSSHPLEHIDLQKIPVPRNLNIVMIGDSVTRYQYISLVYFLKFGTWINMKHQMILRQHNIVSPTTNNNHSHHETVTMDDTNHNMYHQPNAMMDLVPHMGMIWKNSGNNSQQY
jgi:hypothetical protein